MHGRLLWAGRGLLLRASRPACRHARLRQPAALMSSSPISDAQSQASTAPLQDLQRRLARKAKTRAELKDPANIGAVHSAEVSTKDWGGDVSLSKFMRLPVSAYYELDKAMIRPLPGNHFALVVPRVHLFNIWLEPLVETAVDAQPDEITIRALNCRISGSDLVESLGLDSRFCVEFTAKLMWTPGQQLLPGSQPKAEQAGGGFSLFGLGRSSPAADPSQGRVKGVVDLQVYSEVIGPFNFMPRIALEGGGNAVMGALVRLLLPQFLRRLVEDYQRWATDPVYRAARGRRKD